MTQQPDSNADGTITQLLKRLSAGESAVRNELWQLVYDRLHVMAALQMRGERTNHALQPTALVNEAYLRIGALQELDWRDRRHFFGVAASVMRRILVDEARKRAAVRRGGGEGPVPLDTSQIMPKMRNSQVVFLHEALQRLKDLDPRQAEIVEFRFFVGLTVREVADLLRLSERTVEGDWNMARTWLRHELQALE